MRIQEEIERARQDGLVVIVITKGRKPRSPLSGAARLLWLLDRPQTDRTVAEIQALLRELPEAEIVEALAQPENYGPFALPRDVSIDDVLSGVRPHKPSFCENLCDWTQTRQDHRD